MFAGVCGVCLARLNIRRCERALEEWHKIFAVFTLGHHWEDTAKRSVHSRLRNKLMRQNAHGGRAARMLVRFDNTDCCFVTARFYAEDDHVAILADMLQAGIIDALHYLWYQYSQFARANSLKNQHPTFKNPRESGNHYCYDSCL